MKYLFLIAFLMGCTQKYADFDLIRKADFQQKSYERPLTRMQVLPSGHDQLKNCFNQWLFFSNAEKEKDNALPQMVRALCPRESYLMDTRITEDWWTLIVFSRACVDIESKCAKEKKE
jgi:hypothetical protein